jgi:alkylhydroperoxidase family enzyme
VTGASRTEAEAAAVAVAEALSTVPHQYTPELGKSLHQHFSPGDAEWIVMSVAMMGFLNKFMDAIGVELEPEAVNDVAELIQPTGWSVGQHGWAGVDDSSGAATETNAETNTSGDGGDGAPPTDSMGTMLRVFRNAPSAMKLEKRWMADLPKGSEDLRRHIADSYHFDEPLLAVMNHRRVIRALGAMLRQNLDSHLSELGIGSKALAGLVFARHVGNQHLIDRSRQLAEHCGLSAEIIGAAETYQPGDGPSPLDDKTAAAVAMAYDISPSPAAVSDKVLELADSALSPAETVEIAVWVSVCQLIHRLTVFFELDDA